MQRIGLAAACTAAVLLSPCGALSAGAYSALRSAKSSAASWLEAHAGAPQADELADLKAENPSAYAIVQALLTKHSLGLLDPRRPAASLVAPPTQDLADLRAHGAGDGAAEPAADAGSRLPQHRDWMSWRPPQSALEDDAAVSQILDDDPAVAGVDVAPAPVAAAAVPPRIEPELAAPADVVASPTVVASAPLESDQVADNDASGNPYLRGLGLEPKAKKANLAQGAQPRSYLKDFSWDDDAAPVVPAAGLVSAVPAVRVTGRSAGKLLDWLDVGAESGQQ